MQAAEFDHHAIEAQVRALWDRHDIYRYDRGGSGPVFSVDTPPPYVSASHLHVGHAMSYSQADFIVRYRRMRGDRVFYPIGFDDNGLPTERYVEQAHGVTARDLPRAEFVALCLAETSQTAARYEQVWRRLGLSVDWSLRYSTIDDRCRRTAQASFLKLHRAGHIRRAADPILWCPHCRTALAQADVEDLTRSGRMHRIAFNGGDDGQPLVIATTRPELLPACVALYHHPDDSRYQHLRETTATVPLFSQQVPIHRDEAVDPQFGTGLMMVCTFGDSDDVARWRRDQLALRLVVTGDGRLDAVAGRFAGQPLAQARSSIVAALDSAGALVGSDPVRQVVGVHERCLTPVEFLIRPQWFVNVTEHRDRLLARAGELQWVPPQKRRRLVDWIDGLKWDWNLSRQRHYGVPFPVWFCRSCRRPALPELSSLPVDPLTDPPPVPACRHCGAADFAPDPDVMDTWFTSSLSPQINDGWASGGSDPLLAPMSLRVQGFEIIRTWLFYTLVQSHLHFDRLPWRAVMVSGWGLNEQGRKIAKRDLARSATADGYNRYLPDQVIERYGADALRLWATRARIGADLRYHEKDVRTGRKLVIKLWNVARFVATNAGPEPAPPAERTGVDRWLLAHLAEAVEAATAALDDCHAMAAHQAAARFFWSIYCDRYVEMVKPRFLYPDEHTEAERDSARNALWESLRALLGLFAPFAPYVTEHLYQQLYRPYEQPVSLHLTSWPAPSRDWRAAGTARTDIDRMASILDQVRVLRSRLRLGATSRLAAVVLDAGTPDGHRLVGAIAEPLRATARAKAVVYGGASHDTGVPGVRVDVIA
jgi:valyl-tRNA synthetase